MTGHIPRFTSPNLPKALCVNFDPELWYADDAINPDLRDVEWAREICSGCAERLNCLGWALENEKHGMWGGFTANERRYLRERKFNKLQHLKERKWF